MKQYLEAVRELLSEESRWCKDESARDQDGNSVSPFAESASSWCIFGAFRRLACIPREEGQALIDFVASYTPGCSIARFNDAPETTHADILNLLDQAISQVVE